MPSHDDEDRDESRKERVARDARAAQRAAGWPSPGVQVLFAFLLTVPFSQRFSDSNSFQRDAYYLTLLVVLAIAITTAVVLVEDFLFGRPQSLLQRRRTAQDPS